VRVARFLLVFISMSSRIKDTTPVVSCGVSGVALDDAVPFERQGGVKPPHSI